MNTNAGQLLQALVVLTEEQSVSRAARRMGCSQPTASRLLSALRKKLEDPVLVRAGGRLQSTPRAQSLSKKARELNVELERLLSPVDEFDPVKTADQFVISAPEYLENWISPLILSLMRSAAPGASLLVRPPSPLTADRHLESGELDLRLGWVADPSTALRARPLYTEPLVCIMSAQHPLAQRPLSIDAFTSYPHLRHQASMPSTASRQLDAALHKKKAAVSVAMVLPSWLTIGETVAHSELLAVVPSRMASKLQRMLDLYLTGLPVSVPALRASMYWHQTVHLDARHRWFRQLVADAARRWIDPVKRSAMLA